jgi:hypothetical protein
MVYFGEGTIVMRTVRMTERTGLDGVLQVRIPLGTPEADFDVVIVVQPKSSLDSSSLAECSGVASDANPVAWTDELNARRCQLIDQKLQRALSDAEAAELESLQMAMRLHLNRIAPLPLEGAKQLHSELLRKQQSA